MNIKNTSRRHTPTILVALSCSLGCGAHAEEWSDDLGQAGDRLHSAAMLLPTHTPSACWVQDPESTRTDTQFTQETAAIQAIIAEWEQNSGVSFSWQGRCGPPTIQPHHQTGQLVEVYPEHIRILYNERFTGTADEIPGLGCDFNNDVNWGSFPDEQSARRYCQFNSAMPPGGARNNYLHEAGHLLGFYHEHDRSENTDPECRLLNGPIFDGLLLTDYDIMSVMHYEFNISSGQDCIAPGSWGSDGLSAGDRLGVEIAYPKSASIPIKGGLSYGGGAVVRSGETIQPEWYARGAKSTVFGNLTWRRGTTFLSSNIVLATTALAQELPHDVRLSFTDPWSRNRAGQVNLVVSNAKHAAVLGVVSAVAL